MGSAMTMMSVIYSDPNRHLTSLPLCVCPRIRLGLRQDGSANPVCGWSSCKRNEARETRNSWVGLRGEEENCEKLRAPDRTEAMFPASDAAAVVNSWKYEVSSPLGIQRCTV